MRCGGGPQIFDTRISARTYENRVDLHLLHGCAGGEAHVRQCPLGRFAGQPGGGSRANLAAPGGRIRRDPAYAGRDVVLLG